VQPEKKSAEVFVSGNQISCEDRVSEDSPEQGGVTMVIIAWACYFFAVVVHKKLKVGCDRLDKDKRKENEGPLPLEESGQADRVWFVRVWRRKIARTSSRPTSSVKAKLPQPGIRNRRRLPGQRARNKIRSVGKVKA